jgi:hypothetical protein
LDLLFGGVHGVLRFDKVRLNWIWCSEAFMAFLGLIRCVKLDLVFGGVHGVLRFDKVRLNWICCSEAFMAFLGLIRCD